MLLVFARRIHTLFERQIFYAMLVVNSVCTCAATVWIKKNSLVKDDPHDLVGASMHLLFDVKTLTKLIDIGEVKVKGKILGVAEAGTLKAWCLFGVPIVVRQYNPNFKEKWHIGRWPLLSLSRTPSSHVVRTETEDRPPCLYLSLGSLPFYDNRSGIPRVAKNLCREGLRQDAIKFVPVYPDPVTGVYRRADSWCAKQGWLTDKANVVDEEISVRPGDWLVQTMINANALEFDAAYLASFRQAGGRLGAILHDIIAEEHPEFFKPRDGLLFSKWLRLIVSYDGIFAISKATEDAFKAWLKRTNLDSSVQIVHFHLGADFKKPQENMCNCLPAQITARPFFLQVSTLEPRKGYEQLLSSFEVLWASGVEVNLVIVGRRGWMMSKFVRRMKNHPALNKNLFWFAGASDDELLSLYKLATGVVVASEAEGFGLSVAEGLWHGKPVIARDIPVFREIGNEGLIYFSGMSSEAIANAVRIVLHRDPSKSIFKPKTLTWAESFANFAQLLQKFS